MKKTFVLLILLLSTITSFAVKTDKQYKKIIETYDVADEAKAIDSINPSAFWKAVIENNELYTKFVNDMKKNKGAEKEALKKASQFTKFYPQYDETIDESMQGFCDTLLMDMGISKLGLNCSLHLIKSDEPNAFTALTEDGFAMCISTGLLSKKGVNYDTLKGYVAHLFAHGALHHQIRGYYSEAKKSRKNAILGGVALGLVCLTAGLEGYNKTTYDKTDRDNTVVVIQPEAKKTDKDNIFRFLQNQEYEADLIAYRFLEHLGQGEEFINGLRILGAAYDDSNSETSCNPEIGSRIDFLRYVKNHPELGNTKNPKLKKKRLQNH